MNSRNNSFLIDMIDFVMKTFRFNYSPLLEEAIAHMFYNIPPKVRYIQSFKTLTTNKNRLAKKSETQKSRNNVN